MARHCGALVLAVLLCLSVWPAEAQTRIRTHALRYSVVARATLTLSANSLSFPSADPDTVPLVLPAGGAVTITVKASVFPGGLVALTVAATDDLRSGLDAISVSALQWTASGDGFAPSGAMSHSTPQPVGNWTGSGSRIGEQVYGLVNSWSYATGSYSTTLIYTLTTP